MASIKERIGTMAVKLDAENYRYLFTSILTDIATIAADVTALATALDTLAAKLNDDGGVTDEDYSEGNVAALTTDADAMSLTE